MGAARLVLARPLKPTESVAASREVSAKVYQNKEAREGDDLLATATAQTVKQSHSRGARHGRMQIDAEPWKTDLEHSTTLRDSAMKFNVPIPYALTQNLSYASGFDNYSGTTDGLCAITKYNEPGAQSIAQNRGTVSTVLVNPFP
ncbi:hypothetical protein RB195_006453 [Necator americanus]|uniref:SCP domain-containing protein n=1 Tax=Necator americanus TaxID=51031 RepID=A0ABR1BSN7_NECAM